MGWTKIDAYKMTHMYMSSLYLFICERNFMLLYLFMEETFPKPFHFQMQPHVQKLKE